MTDQSLIMSGPEIVSTLNNRTQIRRVIKPQPPKWVGDIEDSDYPNEWFWWVNGEKSESFLCPYGEPGDRLWVQETWKLEYGSENTIISEEGTEYAAKPFKICYRATELVYPNGPWKPSVHMPRKYSRLTLEITDVQVERLQNISEEGARAEGKRGNASGPWGCEGLIEDFADSWDSIYAKRGYGWEINPWVWVLKFKRV